MHPPPSNALTPHLQIRGAALAKRKTGFEPAEQILNRHKFGALTAYILYKLN